MFCWSLKKKITSKIAHIGVDILNVAEPTHCFYETHEKEENFDFDERKHFSSEQTKKRRLCKNPSLKSRKDKKKFLSQILRWNKILSDISKFWAWLSNLFFYFKNFTFEG